MLGPGQDAPVTLPSRCFLGPKKGSDTQQQSCVMMKACVLKRITSIKLVPRCQTVAGLIYQPNWGWQLNHHGERLKIQGWAQLH